MNLFSEVNPNNADRAIALFNKHYANSSEENITIQIVAFDRQLLAIFCTKLGNTSDYFLGETHHVYYKLHFTDYYMASQVNIMLMEMFPIMPCFHSYDCCGNLYNAGASVVGMQPNTESSENLESSKEWIVCNRRVRNI